MPKFKKKPVEIEAFQYTGDNHLELSLFTGGHFSVFDQGATLGDGIVAEVFDVLHDTWVGVHVGDWIIRGVKGEHYPCAADVFVETYTEAA